MLRAARVNAGRTTSLIRTGGRSVPFTRRDELKNIDLNFGAQFPIGTATGTLALLNPIAQGTDASTRIGRKVMMKSLYIRMSVAKSATSVGESPLRVLVVYDKQANGLLAAATDILTSPDRITSQMNLGNGDRFKVILDKEFRFGSLDNTSVYFKKYAKLNLPMTFNAGTTAVVGAIQTGSLIMLTYSNGNLLTVSPTHFIETRLRYSD